MLSGVNAECCLSRVLPILSVVYAEWCYAECCLCRMLLILSVVYAKCFLY